MAEQAETGDLIKAIRQLEERVNQQRRRLRGVTAICLLLFAVAVLTRTGPVQASPADPGSILRVRGLSIVDERGTERVYIGAPVVDPTRFGKRFRRDGPVSGILLFDRDGNERSGYVTTDTARSSVFFTLDSLERQHVLFIAPDIGGAHLRFFDKNDNRLEVGVSEYTPNLTIQRGGQIVFQQPPAGPDR